MRLTRANTVLLLMRVYALYNRNRFLLAAILAIGSIGGTLVIVWFLYR